MDNKTGNGSIRLAANWLTQGFQKKPNAVHLTVRGELVEPPATQPEPFDNAFSSEHSQRVRANGNFSSVNSIARQSGFILIYVVGLLAAIALILFEIGRSQTPAPLYMEKQIDHQLQIQQEQILLDFIIAGTQPQKIQNDSRLTQYKRILAANSIRQSDVREEVEWLKSALAKLNFKIDVPTGKNEAGTSTKDKEEPAKKEAAQPTPQETLFQPRKLPYTLKIDQTEYTIRILPGNALPNLNALAFDPLWRYLRHLDIPEKEAKELAAAVIDWRDEDSFITEGIGAESEYYSGMNPPYSPRNAPIRTWQELNYIRGMNPERMRLLRDNFMLGQPGARGVLLEHASPEILTALTGLKPETVQSIMSEYGKLGEKNIPVGAILLSNEATIFERAASWAPDPTLLRIQITAPDSILTADYDSTNRRIIGWW